MRRRNPGYVPNGVDDAGLQYIYAQPLLNDPRWYINPFLAGRSFFSKVEVSIDGTKMEEPAFDDQGHQYQYLNRLLTTETIRRTKYGDSVGWISRRSHLDFQVQRAATQGCRELVAVPGVLGDFPNSVWAGVQQAVDYVPAREHKPCSQLAKAMISLTFDGRGRTRPNILPISFDGVFPIGSQNNTLRAMTGVVRHNGYLHPGAEICFTLHQRKPSIALIERAEVTDPEYFEAAGVIPAPAHDNWELEMIGLELVYEACTIQRDADLKKINNGVARYIHDYPYMRTNLLNHGTRQDSQTVSLVPGVRLMYITFMHEAQLQHGVKANSWMSTRFTYPPYMEEVKISITGKDGILFHGGIVGLGTREGHGSVTMASYYGDLCKYNIYSRPFEDFIPPVRTGAVLDLGYDRGIIAIPCLDYEIEDSKEMTLTFKYTQEAEPRWRLRVWAVVERAIEQTKDNRWTWHDLTS